jgi:aminoglycoside phosphotransferase family enzyme/predicted kinase
MEPGIAKHKQLPPIDVSGFEIEEAVRDLRNFSFDEWAEEMDQEQISTIEVIHTHMSMVFLLSKYVVKIKKSVDYGFADFSSLYKRFRACMAEVQLNQRLAPQIYLGVIPISMQRKSRKITVRFGDYWTHEKNEDLEYWMNDRYGEIVEWAVIMVRLKDENSLLYLLEHQKLTETLVTSVARTVVNFHQNARRSSKIDMFGKEDIIRANIQENFDQTKQHVGVTVSERVYKRIVTSTFQGLNKLRETIESRVINGCICDTHGDLRLEHVYIDDPYTCNFIIIDCIEFNEQFRYGDPIADAAFLMMDMWRKGQPELARLFQNQYMLRSDQESPQLNELFLFYAAYRAVVRAKVSGFRFFDKSLSDAHRQKEVERARCYWLVALTLLSNPSERPCLLMLGGLPASGKSSLAKMLTLENEEVEWLRADAIRKSLASNEAQKNISEGYKFEAGIYSPSFTEKTYKYILEKVVEILREGNRVIVDATFCNPSQRNCFIDVAKKEGALFALIICECDREINKGRIISRKNDISDASWEVYEEMEKKWVPPPQSYGVLIVNTAKEKELSLRRVKKFLRKIMIM